jgi:hypothetical protein
MTPVGRDEQGRFRELRLSTYKGQTIWDVTSGQTTPPKAGADHLGRILSSDDLRDCFFCHTTVARSARDQTGPESADPGIGCERCHGPGGHHLRAISLGFPDVAIANPGAGRGGPLVALCGGCHGPMGRDVPPTDPLAPRFPAPSLTRSRCYTESAAAIDCLTCHEPHRDVETSEGYYERKCLECHSNPIGAVTSIGAPNAMSTARPSHCPVNPARGCLECHMPKVDTPVPHTPFTDHHIRIRSDKNPRGRAAG